LAYVGLGRRRARGQLAPDAAMKQKAANATSTEPVSTTAQSGSTPPSVFFAPTPAASDTSPVRTQAA